MRQDYETSRDRAGHLRDAMRTTPRVRAVVHSELHHIVIEFSDGRTHSIPLAQCIAADQLLAAAVSWCRRHGADVVEFGGGRTDAR